MVSIPEPLSCFPSDQLLTYLEIGVSVPSGSVWALTAAGFGRLLLDRQSCQRSPWKLSSCEASCLANPAVFCELQPVFS